MIIGCIFHAYGSSVFQQLCTVFCPLFLPMMLRQTLIITTLVAMPMDWLRQQHELCRLCERCRGWLRLESHVIVFFSISTVCLTSVVNTLLSLPYKGDSKHRSGSEHCTKKHTLHCIETDVALSIVVLRSTDNTTAAASLMLHTCETLKYAVSRQQLWNVVYIRCWMCLVSIFRSHKIPLD